MALEIYAKKSNLKTKKELLEVTQGIDINDAHMMYFRRTSDLLNIILENDITNTDEFKQKFNIKLNENIKIVKTKDLKKYLKIKLLFDFYNNTISKQFLIELLKIKIDIKNKYIIFEIDA